MIKFLLGFVALIVVLLATYMFTSKPNEIPKKTITKVEKKDVSKKQMEESTTTQVKSPTVEVEKQKFKNVLTSLQQHSQLVNRVKPTDEIGKNLTLEIIENTNVSDEEKQIMIGEMLYYDTTHRPESEINFLSKKEIYNKIHNNMKNLQNQ